MKIQFLIFFILFSLISCKPSTNCFGKRTIIEEIDELLRFEDGFEPILVKSNGKKYIACNIPDTLKIGQIYQTKIALLKTEPSEKWVGIPCEILNMEITQGIVF